jgi:hypothetical protein
MTYLPRHLSSPLGAIALLTLACGDDGGRSEASDSQATPGTNPSSISLSDPSLATTGETTAPTTTGMTEGDSQSTTQPATDPSATVGETTSTTDPTAVTVTDPGTETTVGTTDPMCQSFTCSDDNQSVLCDGVVAEVCAQGTYCVDGDCTPLTPCEAAKLF